MELSLVTYHFPEDCEQPHEMSTEVAHDRVEESKYHDSHSLSLHVWRL